MGWRTDMESAPTDTPHLRGLWVYCSTTGRPLYFDAVAGYDDLEGSFVYSCGDCCGWRPEDFTHWQALDAPPEAQP